MYAPIVLLIFLLFLGVTSCTDTSKQTKQVEQTPSMSQTTVKSAETITFKSKEEKGKAINDIYSSFIYEKTVCQTLVKTLAEDPDFVAQIEKLGYRERNIVAMLPKSKIAQTEIVRYVITHPDYFTVDCDYHGGPGMTYVEGSTIYCAQTDKRLKELEAFGPSKKAWTVREQDLDLSVDNLLAYDMPGAEEGPIGYNVGTLMAEFDFAKKLYSKQFKEPMKKWVQKSATRLRENVDNTNEALDIKKQHTIEIEKWISELNQGLD